MVAVALWIVWVAPYVLRNGRHQFQAAGELMVENVDHETANPQAGTVLHMTAQQENPMDTRKSSESAARFTPAKPGGKPAANNGGTFRIRYGRAAIALAGLLLFGTALISGALAIFGLASGWLPPVSFLAGVAAVVLLRRLAVRDRRRKVNAAFSAAMGAPAKRPDRAVQPAVPQAGQAAEETAARRESTLFDAEAAAPEPKRLTAVELREAALAVALAAGDNSGQASTAQDAAAPADESAPWEPVEVPKPTYVEAAKAERPAPQPLDLPEAPKAAGKPSLKQGNAAAPAVASPNAGQARPQGKAQSALSNLDDVLQRRRA
ncbi:hypothetical protein GCM10009589_38340 [Arthrobacter pascens]